MSQKEIKKAINKGLVNYYKSSARIAMPSDIDFDKQVDTIIEALHEAGYIIVEGIEFESHKKELEQ